MHLSIVEILENYPYFPDSLPIVMNEAIATFICSHLDVNIRHLTSSVDHKGGLGLLLCLKTIYAAATHVNQQHALNSLQDLQMQPKESMTTIGSHFRKTLQHLHHTTMDLSQLPQDQQSLVILFIQKL
jgi:hypothetical protein